MSYTLILLSGSVPLSVCLSPNREALLSDLFVLSDLQLALDSPEAAGPRNNALFVEGR